MSNNRAPIVHSPGVLAIPLTRGLFALIDEADAPLVVPHLWCAHKATTGGFYAKRKLPQRGPIVSMHRALLGDAAEEIDHINGDGLDNRRANLRPATSQQNKWNKPKQANNSSGYKGVSLDKRRGAWRALAKTPDGVYKWLGSAATAIEAAEIYDRYVIATRGEFARPNFAHGTGTS